MQSLIYWLWLVPAFALLSAAVRIIASGKARTYPLLLALIFASIGAFIAGNFAYAGMDPRLYARYWVGCYLAIWSLTALALTEACTRSLEPYENFGRVGRRIINGVLTFTGLLIGGWLVLAPPQVITHFYDFFRSQAYLVQASLALLGLCVWGFARWARLRLPASSRLAMGSITLFCLGETALGSGVPARWPSLAFYVGIAWTTLCWGALALLWSHRPEEVVAQREPLDDERVKSILSGLESTNRGLAGIVRRI